MLRNNIQLLYRCYAQKPKLSILSKSNLNLVRKCSSEAPKIVINQSEIDTFGSLSTKSVTESELVDKGDITEEKYLENISSHGERLRISQYADIIKTYIKKRQIKEAIEVMENRMIKEDRVKPDSYIYNLLLGACGRVGYTKKAFGLFNQMKKRGLKPMGGTYTALFNACANSPWREDGLSRAKKLKELMFEKGVHANDTTYNAMIKAFGRCGDIQTAFAVVDEMIQNQISIKTDVINFLLQSCISDRDTGFLHALIVWRKFKENKITPDIFSFNLLLHCIRECNLGDPDVAKNLLGAETKSLETNDIKQIPTSDLEIPNKADLYVHIPNLLAEVAYLGNMVDLSEIKTAEHRLLLVGGFPGFLKTMQMHNVTPNIKTVTILLDNIPSTTAAEKALLSAMKKLNIKPDIDFLNMLIKKRCLRFDYSGAKEVMILFEKFKYRPNIFTYGVLALCCETLEEARTLLKEMLNAGYRVNTEILGALLRQACVKANFVYVLEIMELVIKEKINPNKKFLEHLEKLYTSCIEELKNGEKKSTFWTKGFHIFRMRYKTWLKEVQPDQTEGAHPWEQFRKPTETKVKNYKDPQVHFKPRITSRFRQKTGTLAKDK